MASDPTAEVARSMGARGAHTASRAASPKRVEHSATGDILFGWLTRGVAAFTFILLAAIIVSLMVASWPSISKFGVSFLWSTNWDPPRSSSGPWFRSVARLRPRSSPS